MNDQIVTIRLNRDQVLWLKAALEFLDDPKVCREPLRGLRAIVTDAFRRLDRKGNQKVLKAAQMPLIDYIEGKE
jgi:hypothetical protein